MEPDTNIPTKQGLLYHEILDQNDPDIHLQQLHHQATDDLISHFCGTSTTEVFYNIDFSAAIDFPCTTSVAQETFLLLLFTGLQTQLTFPGLRREGRGTSVFSFYPEDYNTAHLSKSKEKERDLSFILSRGLQHSSPLQVQAQEGEGPQFFILSRGL